MYRFRLGCGIIVMPKSLKKDSLEFMQFKKRILGECLSIISFPGKALRTLLLNRNACLAIQHAFSKPCLVNLISKDVNLVFNLLAFKLAHSSNERL